MKKTLILLIFTLFATVQNANAADTCDAVRGIPVNVGDPACYTSEYISSGYSCTWSLSSTPSLCDSHSSWISGVSYVTQVASCSDCSNPCRDNVVYSNTCGGGHCTNSGPVPSDTWTDTSHYENTCHYLTVDTWSECDENGIQSATSVTQHSTSGTNCDNLNEETTRNCGMCNSLVAGVATGTAPGTSPQTEVDLCSYSNTSPIPFPAELKGKMWEWKCFGDSISTTEDTIDGNGVVTSYSDDTLCSAPNEEAAECNTAFADADPLLATAPTENDELCSGGIYDPNSLIGGTTGPWSWNCLRIGNNPNHALSVECSAECFEPVVEINPNPFIWPTNLETEAIVKVSVTKSGVCSNEYSCKIENGDDIPDNLTIEYEISQPSNGEEIKIICSAEGYEDKTSAKMVSGYCIARECNTQGTCQITPVSSDSYNGPACTSSCNSNADCSSGQIIETRP